MRTEREIMEELETKKMQADITSEKLDNSNDLQERVVLHSELFDIEGHIAALAWVLTTKDFVNQTENNKP